MTRFLILWSEICDKVQYRQITLQNILKSEVNSKTKEKERQSDLHPLHCFVILL